MAALTDNKKPKKKLTRSMEDYLEAIYVLVEDGKVPRVRDIAGRLAVSMSSVTAAMKSLARRDLVNYDPYELVTLTEAGRLKAQQVNRRHEVIRRFLAGVLGLSAAEAEANACRMEHAVDEALLERLIAFAEFIHTCPRAGGDWIEQFQKFCAESRDEKRCRKCVKKVSTRPGRTG